MKGNQKSSIEEGRIIL